MNTSPATKTRRQAWLGSFGLWLAWVVASTFGYSFSLMLAIVVLAWGEVCDPDTVGIILFLLVPTNLICGLMIGGLQFLVLRRRLERPGTWILWTALGWIFAGLVPFISLCVLTLKGMVLPGLVTGTIMGICQWMVLRRTVKAAIWWIPVSALGWALGMFTMFMPNWIPGLVISIGVVTGLALVVLLYKSDHGT